MGFYLTTPEPAVLEPQSRKPESAYPRFAGVGSGTRFYNPCVGRWPSRDPIGERLGGPHKYLFVYNRPVLWVDKLGLHSVGDCWSAGITPFDKSLSKKIPGTSFKISGGISGSVSGKLCKKCCPDGRIVIDKTVSVTVGGNASLSASSWVGNYVIPIVDIEVDWWAGLKAAISASGSASGDIETDKCNNVDLQGTVCFKATGAGSISGGGEATLKAGDKETEVGLTVTGSGSISIERCYVCNSGSCAWDPVEVCLAGSADATIKFHKSSFTWEFWSDSTCFNP